MSRFLADRVRARRRHLDLTQVELAKSAHIHRSYLAEIEGGDANPTADVIWCLALGLRVEVSYLFPPQPAPLPDDSTPD